MLAEEKDGPLHDISLRVFRTNRMKDKSAHYDTFGVPVQRWSTVLDALLYVKRLS